MLYVPHESSFMSSQFFVLNLTSLTSLIFFDIPLLYYYINLRSSTIFCTLSGDIYLSLGISALFSTVSEVFCSDLFEVFVILLALLLLINTPVASVVFVDCFFEVVLSESVEDNLASS